MKCFECDVEMLDDYLVGGLDDDKVTLVEQHVASCEDCSARLDDLRGCREMVRKVVSSSPELESLARGIDALGQESGMSIERLPLPLKGKFWMSELRAKAADGIPDAEHVLTTEYGRFVIRQIDATSLKLQLSSVPDQYKYVFVSTEDVIGFAEIQAGTADIDIDLVEQEDVQAFNEAIREGHLKAILLKANG